MKPVILLLLAPTDQWKTVTQINLTGLMENVRLPITVNEDYQPQQ